MRQTITIILSCCFFCVHAQEGLFEQFTEKDGLSSNKVYDMAMSSTGEIWLATDRGLCSFGGIDFMCRNTEEEVTNLAVSENHLYYGTGRGMVYRYSKRGAQKVLESPLIKNNILC